ncbi:MAG: homoserine dehydrogenase [Phycisphaeraceae bacterium]|nr:homoserine dehydrogenase [Phycisphaeraceae bacterium]
MRIALVGFGSVGRAFAALLRDRRDDLYAREGLLTSLVAVIDSRGAALGEHGLDPDQLLEAKSRTGSVGDLPIHGLTADRYGTPDRLLAGIGADVLVEATPSSINDPLPALANLRAAMSRGMHAVTVNKAPLATAMSALADLAEHNRVLLRFSGAVGAGTPVLSTARALARGDVIESVRAILNGTTNFILWSMAERNVSYADALSQAQRMGLAETDPSADVDGIDAAVKIVILANSVMGLNVRFDQVAREGIRDISPDRLRDAASRAKTLKLIARIDSPLNDAPARLSVRPEEIDRHSPLDVPETGNAVQFNMRTAGEVTLVGAGAGGPQTAVAILRDLVDIWHASSHQEHRP